MHLKKFTAADAAECLPQRDDNSHKGNFGYIALIGGSVRYSGAVRLADISACALRSGAGVVSVAAPDVICSAIMPQILESTLIPLSSEGGFIKFNESEFSEIAGRYDVIAFGMGTGNTEETLKAVRYILDNYTGILIVDADGINAMSKLTKEEIAAHKCKLIITPHLKEFSTISGVPVSELNTLKADDKSSDKPNNGNNVREHCAVKLARQLNAVVLLKGHVTFVTDGNVSYLVEKGCAGMATAGSGDVLSGIAAGLCASNKDKLTEAVAAAAYINGLAGEMAEMENGRISMIASDTAGRIKDAVNSIVSSRK